MRQRWLVWIALVMVWASCSSEVDQRYVPRRAFVRFAPVTAVPALHSALNNPGVWCALHYDATHYHFVAPSGRVQSYPLTARDRYGMPMSIAGFLIGTPQLPTLSSGAWESRAYDRVCPSCYESAYVERALQVVVTQGNRAACPRCHRRYDLDTGAPLEPRADGQVDRGLYRYRMSYNAVSDIFFVQN